MSTTTNNIHKWLAAIGFLTLFVLASCKSSTSPTTTPSTPFVETALVSDTLGYNAALIDTTFANGWGISVGPTGLFWLSSNHGGVTDIYDGNGVTKKAPVTIPSNNGTDPGAPTGVIYNGTADFGSYLFIYAGEDGIIAGWKAASGSSAVKLATDASSGAVYKGIAMASTGGNNYLYVTDFGENKIVVYDKNFQPVSMTFTEGGSPAIPIGTPGFGPFGIQNIGGLLYVTYAKHKPAPDDGDDAGGAGNGYVSVFKPDGTFVKRFASQGTLSSPWGIAVAPSTFGQFKNAILVANFGDGTISGFDSTGASLGQISTDANNTPMHIPGIWGLLSTGSTSLGNGDVPNALYFTAGPHEEDHGIFGYVLPQ
ncbi:MAG: TIGR03118 family protein [Bacteroidota bacterium]|nr:TIGR03118 family protein [Bacteroidota bacterium]MDP4229975.1 TIGR03118 family protein [Bacteroidota bacterium]MDP4235202.1 TIGR03118 family protein [Bacteroidota bacterium]